MTRGAAIAAALMVLAAAASCGAIGKESTMTHNPEPSASRAPPPRVPPVFIAGVRYAQVAGDPEADGQVGGLLAAYDASSRELWRRRGERQAAPPNTRSAMVSTRNEDRVVRTTRMMRPHARARALRAGTGVRMRSSATSQ